MQRNLRAESITFIFGLIIGSILITMMFWPVFAKSHNIIYLIIINPILGSLFILVPGILLLNAFQKKKSQEKKISLLTSSP
ncbi:MAG: hypothetical protein GPJ52_16235 [Candidatus Heimdallarchaeota archaeon]|nr:hypothetical protein [Candidatus Heimdallarchaeota archaeon]